MLGEVWHGRQQGVAWAAAASERSEVRAGGRHGAGAVASCSRGTSAAGFGIVQYASATQGQRRGV